MTEPLGPGALVAVIGASGVGKDTLLDEARRICGATAFFPRRTITRPAGAGEDHVPVTAEEFALRRARGAFAVCWHAHGLDYALPASVDDAIEAGAVVVANVSRAVLGVLRARYASVVAVRVSVPDAVREARIRGRSRETGDAVVERLDRPDPLGGRPVDHEIVNDGTVEAGADALVAVIEAARPTLREDARA